MSAWRLVYDGFDPDQEGLREALCTLGNGYFATRGAAPESNAGEVHYPGTYLAGGYDRATTEVAGKTVENEDLVNLPNWLPLTFRPAGGEWFRADTVERLDYRQTLDMRHGVLERLVRGRDAAGRVTRVVERRIVHMAARHLAALEITITPENWSGPIEITSALDGRVVNAGVKRYRDLEGRHLDPLETGAVDTDTIWMTTRTRQSRLEIGQAARTRLFQGTTGLPVPLRVEAHDGFVAGTASCDVQAGNTLRVEKVVALYSSRDHAISECGLEARTAVRRAGGFEDLLRTHALAWRQLWRRFDLHLEETSPSEGERASRIVHLHAFHLLQTASPHTRDLDAGVPARGWHGEAYRGHIFWDELFVFPWLNWRMPEITRALLLYRHRRLDEARANARAEGFRGALYPWQSGSSGREETQRLHLNPESGRWLPDDTRLQRHVNAAVAYNIWQYYQVSHDQEFLRGCGAEMFLEIARFWASVATFNPGLDRFEIRGVVGPDEFHTMLPGRDTPGLDNNAYTNIMAVWVLWRALELLASLPEEQRTALRERLDLSDEELAHWDEVSRRMRVLFLDNGVIAQFEGYDTLEEIDWANYRRRYADLHRLDRILEAEGDTVNRYRVSKQPDVLMLFYLFSSEELDEMFGRLGYPFARDTIPRTVEYYAHRTSHGSTLSRVVFAWVLARADRPRAWRLFNEALESDVTDIQGGTTPEGIHLGAMAGTLDLIQRGFTGIVTRSDVLWLNPCLPDDLKRLAMTLQYRGHILDLRFTRRRVEIHAHGSNLTPLAIGVSGTRYEVEAGKTRVFDVRPTSS